MKKIFAIFYKDTRLRFASASEWLFFLILPLIFTFLLAGGTPSGDGDNRLRLLVVDQANTPFSAEIVASLEKSTSVRPDLMSLEAAEAEFEDRRASALLIIPTGMDMNSLQAGQAQVELRKQADINAMAAERAIRVALDRVSSAAAIGLSSLKTAEERGTFESQAGREAYLADAVAEATTKMAAAPDRITSQRAVDKIEYDPRANSSAGQLITWVFIPLLGLSGLLVYEREQGTLRRLLTTPTQRATYLFGTVVGQVLIALLQMALLVWFGTVVMKLNWGHDLGGLALIMLAFALAAAALGVTLGTFVKSESQASGLSIMLGMVTALLGGCWYPLELFPSFVQNMVKVLPTRWAMQGMLDLVLRGGGLADVLPEAGVLFGFAAVFFVIGILRFRYE